MTGRRDGSTSNLRKHVRSTVEVAVTISDTANRVKGTLQFDTQDISVGGAFIRSDLLFEIGEELALTFTLPSGQEVRARGKVVRVARDSTGEGPSAGMGIQFTAIPDGDRDAILQLVNRGSHG